jgi:hypothetical protein
MQLPPVEGTKCIIGSHRRRDGIYSAAILMVNHLCTNKREEVLIHYLEELHEEEVSRRSQSHEQIHIVSIPLNNFESI